MRAGIPILWPPGGHAIYIDASAFLPHIPVTAFPGHAVACAFYLEGGIRSCEIGTSPSMCASVDTGDLPADQRHHQCHTQEPVHYPPYNRAHMLMNEDFAHEGCTLLAGTLMFGGKDPAALDGAERTANLELCRLAVPRRVYTQSHMEYVLEIAQIVAAQKDALQGYQIVQQPQFLRHFSATLAPLERQHSAIVPFPASAGSGDLKEGTAAVSE